MRRLATGVVVAGLLAALFLAYLQADFVVELGNVFAMCR